MDYYYKYISVGNYMRTEKRRNSNQFRIFGSMANGGITQRKNMICIGNIVHSISKRLEFIYSYILLCKFILWF